MSNFSAFRVASSAQVNAITRALVSSEQCDFQTKATVGSLVDLAFFLRLAVSKQICSDQKTLNGASLLADTIVTLIKQEFPCFSDFNFDDPVGYFEAVRESEENTDPELVAIFDSLFQKFRQVVDETDLLKVQEE